MAETPLNENVRYEPDEHPPIFLAIGTGAQAALVTVGSVILSVVIIFRVAGQSETALGWAVFAALLVSGIATILQAVRVWRIGAGHLLVMGTSGAFIAVCVTALMTGGPAMMASLVVVSSLVQFALAARLSLLRRIFTPVVSGTVIMLIAATIMPIVFDTLSLAPDDAPTIAAPVVALVSIITIAGLILRAPPSLRLWSPLIGIVVGCAVAAPFGLYDFRYVLDAPWFGIPLASWPGLDVTPGVEFWALLPAFVVVTIVGAIETTGDGVAIQRVSRRRPRATDYRVVQGALNADGVGNLLSGIAGTVPNTTYSASLSLAELTGIASRRVGVVIGAIFLILAFFPKAAALLIAIPGPVAGAYFSVLLVLLFAQGMRIIVQDGVDYRKAAVTGLAFWIGVGFQIKAIYPDLLGDSFIGALLGNGMTSGAIVAIGMMSFMELTRRRRRRLQVALDSDALPAVDTFLRRFASQHRWDGGATERLTAAGEETLAILLQDDDLDGAPSGNGRRLSVAARMEGGSAEVEFVTALEGENMEDRLAYLGALPEIPDERELSYRLLGYYSSSVRYQKYHGVDIVTVSVAEPR